MIQPKGNGVPAMQKIMVSKVSEIRRAVRLVRETGKRATLRNDIGNAVQVTYDKRYAEYSITEYCDFDDSAALDNTPCETAQDAIETIAYMLLD